MRAKLMNFRQFLASQAYLTTFETVVACGVLVCLSLAVLTATIHRQSQSPLRAVVTIPAPSP